MGKGRKSRKQSGRKPERFYLYFGSEIFGEMYDRKRKAVICIQLIGSRYFGKSAETSPQT